MKWLKSIKNQKISKKNSSFECFNGYLDGITPNGEIHGWGYDNSKPLQRAEIYFTLDGMPLGSVKAETFRADLFAAHKADGYCAFVFKIPYPILKQLKPNSQIQAFFDQTQQYELKKSPIQLTDTLYQQLCKGLLQNINNHDLGTEEQECLLLQLLDGLSNSKFDENQWQCYHQILQLCHKLLLKGEYEWLYQQITLESVEGLCSNSFPVFGLALVKAISSHAVNLLSADELNLLEIALYTEARGGHQRDSFIYKDAILPISTLCFRDLSLMLFDTAPTLTEPSCRLMCLLGQGLVDLYQDNPFAANVFNFIRRNSGGEIDIYLLEKSGKINRLLDKNFEAMQDFALALKANTKSADVYKEVAALQMQLCEGRVVLFRRLLQRVLAFIFTSYRYDPLLGGSLGNLADTFLRQYFQTCIAHTEEMAKSAKPDNALAERRDDLDKLGAAIDSVHDLAGHGCYQPVNADIRAPKRRFNTILFIGSTDLWQCYHYRAVQKMEQAHSLGIATIYQDIGSLENETWKRDIAFSDAIYICRVPAVYNIIKLITYARKLQVPVIYDIDDLLFDERYFPAPIASYAGTIDEAFHAHLILDNPFFEKALQLADFITCSTKPLADRIIGLVGNNKPVAVHPNLLNPGLYGIAHLLSKTQKQNKTIEIFYGSATKAHKQVIYEVFGPALLTILKQYPTVKFTAFGYFELPPELEPYSNKIDFREPTSNREYYLQQLSKADINIAVLEQDPFTDCKSEIKWLEASVYGIPSVVTPTATYRCLFQGETEVLFAANTSEWIRQLSRLIESADLRHEVGQNARRYALKHYNPNVGAKILKHTMATLTSFQNQNSAHTSKKPSLLYVNVWFSPQSVGGAARIFESHVHCLLENYGKDYEVHVLTSQLHPESFAPYSVEQYLFGAALVTRLNVPLRDWSETSDPKVYDFCREYYDKYGFDLIHFHALPILTASVVDAARALKIPYLITLHDGWWLSKYMFLIDEAHELVDTSHCFSNKNNSARQQQMYDCLNNASAILAVSEKFRDIHIQAGIVQTQTNENGLEMFPVLPRTRTNIADSSKVRVAFVGGLSYHKGYDLFREAVTQAGLKNIEVLVIDHSLESGQSYKSRWGTTPVVCQAKYKQSEVNELYASIDVLAAPSIWPESFGLVTREAAYAGVWVIASNRGAVGDCIVDGVNGRVVQVDDASGLIGALLEIDSDPEKFKEPCPQTSVRSVAEQVSELVSLYDKILNQSP